MSMIRCAIGGIASFLPGASLIKPRRPASHKPKATARYCYAVWLRHLITLYRIGCRPRLGVVAELGPGDSIGVGLAALLSGANHYYACDVVTGTNLHDNIPILDELFELVEGRAAIPNEAELSVLPPRLSCYDFPDYLIEDSVIQPVTDEVYNSVRHSLANVDAPDSRISYLVPWCSAHTIEDGSVDMVISQAVLEHVEDLEAMYRTIYKWMRHQGVASHQIDYRSHGTSSQWNGHYAYSDFVWKIMKGRRPYLINREPHSTHMGLARKYGYKVLTENVRRETSSLRRTARRFGHLTEDDLTISGATIQIAK